MRDTLAFVMAGGRGARLMPLTSDRSKPAVPFGGIYRLVDFTLSNCINSQLYRIVVLPQYKSQSLTEHLEVGWNIFSAKLGHFLKIVPPQQRVGLDWYRGTADSIRQNIYLIERTRPKFVLILSGDHIYKMDYSLFLKHHKNKDADVSISTLEVDVEQAHHFGIAVVDHENRILGFQEKPKKDINSIPNDSSRVLASMGIYLFKTESLLEILNGHKGDDFGGDIMPNILHDYRLYAYPYKRFNKIADQIYITMEDGARALQAVDKTRDSTYWRDVGTLDAYWNANMDLTGVDPFFNLYGRRWPIHTYQSATPPAKFVFNNEREEGGRVGKALNSLVAAGCIISGVVRNSVLSYNVIVGSWSNVEESVIMDGVIIGRHCKIKKCIIDKENFIPSGTRIGYDPDDDRRRFTLTERGIVVVPKGSFKG